MTHEHIERGLLRDTRYRMLCHQATGTLRTLLFSLIWTLERLHAKSHRKLRSYLLDERTLHELLLCQLSGGLHNDNSEGE